MDFNFADIMIGFVIGLIATILMVRPVILAMIGEFIKEHPNKKFFEEVDGEVYSITIKKE